MKRIIYFAFLSLFLMGCEQEPKDSYIVDGKAEGVFNGMRVYLSKVNERGAPVPKDTAIVMNETFTFSGKVDYPQMYFVTINGTPGRFPIILENGNSSITIDSKILDNSKYEGSDSHDTYMKFDTYMVNLYKKMNDAKAAVEESTFLNDSVTLKSDKEAYDKVMLAISEYPYSYIEENQDSYAVLPVLTRQVNSRDVNFKRVVSLYEGLDEKVKATDEGQQLQTTLNKMKLVFEAEKATAIGAIAPKFSAPTPDGSMLALNDVVSKGKVTIIDFWAAWCGPCRRENPNVVRIYEKYHDKGLEILGVGLDGRRGQQNPKQAWTTAIEKDGLTWHQVSNLRYFDEIAKAYNVNSIPSMFILDSEGKIIGKNLRGLALERRIGELLD